MPEEHGFCLSLMTHNTKVLDHHVSFGITWGLGTMVLLFYNRVILAPSVTRYIVAGRSGLLNQVATPTWFSGNSAILLAGQAGFCRAHAMIGRNQALPLSRRLRKISGDVVTLICGIALMLIWASIIESFFSQFRPRLFHTLKIGFGALQLLLLFTFYSAGSRSARILPWTQK